MRYEHCVFDLYGTLVDIRTDEDAPELWEAMAAYYGQQGAAWRPGELKAAYRRLITAAEAGKAGPPPRGDAHEAHPEIQIEFIFQRLFREKGVDADLPRAIRAGQRFRRLSTRYIRLYGGARELLTALRRRGCGVWLLSNAQAIFTRWELERLGLLPLFDGVYLSSDYGVKKPDRRFFDVLLRQRHIDPSRAVMVGNDGVCDIQGGREAGLSTLYIRSNLSPDEPTPEADCVLERMDLARALALLTAEADSRPKHSK